MTAETISGSIDDAALARLAALHRDALPRSILTSLGPRAIARYYAYARSSAREQLLVARVDGEVEAGLLVSREPHTLLRRFAQHAPLALARELAWAATMHGSIGHRLAARLRERDTNPAAVAGLPEVTQIFTDERVRGRGLGARLLEACERDLRATGARAYCVHTHRDDNDAGVRFYRRAGFEPVGETRSFGDRFLVMMKGLR